MVPVENGEGQNNTGAKKKQTVFLVPSSLSELHPKTETLLVQSQPLQVLILPVCSLNHGSQCPDWKCVTQRVVGNDDSPSITMSVDAVATAHPLQRKPIGLQRSNESPSL
jgi:hypothetical protein